MMMYEPIHNSFERFCRAKAVGRMDFRDLMNDTLLIAYQKFESLQSEKAFLSFLFGICIRLISNKNRKKREVFNLDSEVINNIPDDTRPANTTEIQLLYRAIAKLPTEQQESILLFEISGFSIKEIAAIHQVSESAVKKRLQRGREKLAQLLLETPINSK